MTLSEERQFELEWLGGAAESRLRRRRPGIDDLPWGTIETGKYSEAAVAEARKVWTNGAFTEYASATAFSAMTTAFLECGAPVDLIALAADVVVDEMSHVELASRIVAELGGAVPYVVDLAAVAPVTTAGISPLLRAAEIAITTSCVGEALSVPMLARSLAASNQALISAVLERLARDEAPHARVGHWFLAWAAERLSKGDRQHLGGVALESVATYAPLWQTARCDSCQPLPALGGIGEAEYRRTMIHAVRTRVVAPLARLGVRVEEEGLEKLLS